MKRHFEEYLKRVFSDDESQDTFHCPVPGIVDDPKAGVEDGFLAISRTDMKFIFDPVIVDVVKLVHEQVQKVEAIGQKVSVRSLSTFLSLGSPGVNVRNRRYCSLGDLEHRSTSVNVSKQCAI